MNLFARTCCFTAIATALSTSASAQTTTSLFDFAQSATSQSSDAASWQIVNDGVMGGRSSSQASIVKLETGGDAMRFAGNLSLENNGGFASVRSRPSGSLGLDPGETIVLRVKGDGRRYTFNLYTPDRRTAFSYQTGVRHDRRRVDRSQTAGRPVRRSLLRPTHAQQ